MKFLAIFFIIPLFSHSFELEEFLDSKAHPMGTHLYWIIGDLMYEHDLKPNTIIPIYRMNSAGKDLTASYLSNGNFFAGYSDGSCYVIDIRERTMIIHKKFKEGSPTAFAAEKGRFFVSLKLGENNSKLESHQIYTEKRNWSIELKHQYAENFTIINERVFGFSKKMQMFKVDATTGQIYPTHGQNTESIDLAKIEFPKNSKSAKLVSSTMEANIQD